RHAEKDLRERNRRVRAEIPPEHRERLRPSRSDEHLRDEWQELRRHHGKHRNRPEPVSARQNRPSRDQEREQRGRHETAAQIVENLPSRDQRERVPLHPVTSRDERKQPEENLPVAANPPVLTPGVSEDG